MRERAGALRTGAADEAWERQEGRAGDERPPIEIAMALCVGLRLPNVLAEDLLGKAGHVLRDTDTDMAYRMILDSMTANSIHEVNRVLRDMRMEPLTGRGPA